MMKYSTCVLWFLSVSIVAAQSSAYFPIVDLGYAKHRPTLVNRTSLFNISYATYANIRFARPPLGRNRFRKPQLPPPANGTIQDGQVPRNATDCLHTLPPFLLAEAGVNGTSWGSEDCLFLDVKVPEGIVGRKVPVLHWLFGGGYLYGSKNDWDGDSSALFQQMAANEKFIVVASNYRTAALGWMSSDTEPSIDRNIGLWDGLTALEWTKKYISRFGGDPDAITVIGESAGGGMAQHLVTAWGGAHTVPFKQAILTSPGYRPHVNRSVEMTDIYHEFLNATSCANVTCLRSLSSVQIAKANGELLLDPSGGWVGPEIGYGPIIDGGLVPDLPDRLLLKGKYQRGVKRVITANMALDGIGQTSLDPKTWEEQLGYWMRTPTAAAVDIAKATWGINVTEGSILFNGDANFACHAFYTVNAITNASATSGYRYSMSVPPATHGQDQFYYFYTGEKDNAAVTEPKIAREMQYYFRNFIVNGTTGGGGSGLAQATWPPYGREQRWMNITSSGFEIVTGETSQASRCKILMDLVNDPANGF